MADAWDTDSTEEEPSNQQPTLPRFGAWEADPNAAEALGFQSYEHAFEAKRQRRQAAAAVPHQRPDGVPLLLPTRQKSASMGHTAAPPLAQCFAGRSVSPPHSSSRPSPTCVHTCMGPHPGREGGDVSPPTACPPPGQTRALLLRELAARLADSPDLLKGLGDGPSAAPFLRLSLAPQRPQHQNDTTSISHSPSPLRRGSHPATTNSVAAARPAQPGSADGFAGGVIPSTKGRRRKCIAAAAAAVSSAAAEALRREPRGLEAGGSEAQRADPSSRFLDFHSLWHRPRGAQSSVPRSTTDPASATTPAGPAELNELLVSNYTLQLYLATLGEALPCEGESPMLGGERRSTGEEDTASLTDTEELLLSDWSWTLEFGREGGHACGLGGAELLVNPAPGLPGSALEHHRAGSEGEEPSLERRGRRGVRVVEGGEVDPPLLQPQLMAEAGEEGDGGALQHSGEMQQGKEPESTQQLAQQQQQQQQQELHSWASRQGPGFDWSLLYCYDCHIWRPARSRHCRTCGRCIDRYDHHCPAIRNCVGRRNHRLFMFLLLIYPVGEGLFVVNSFRYLNARKLFQVDPTSMRASPPTNRNRGDGSTSGGAERAVGLRPRALLLRPNPLAGVRLEKLLITLKSAESGPTPFPCLLHHHEPHHLRMGTVEQSAGDVGGAPRLPGGIISLRGIPSSWSPGLSEPLPQRSGDPLGVLPCWLPGCPALMPSAHQGRHQGDSPVGGTKERVRQSKGYPPMF